MSGVCLNCPFKASSPLGYDADAMECLEAGEEPACHSKVGKDAVFAHVPFEPPHPCIGFLRWAEGVDGFNRPHLSEALQDRIDMEEDRLYMLECECDHHSRLEG